MRLALAGDCADAEIVRLTGEHLLDLEFVRRAGHDEVKALEDGDKRDLRFLSC